MVNGYKPVFWYGAKKASILKEQQDLWLQCMVEKRSNPL
mgnify:CR=1 FL=1